MSSSATSAARTRSGKSILVRARQKTISASPGYRAERASSLRSAVAIIGRLTLDLRLERVEHRLIALGERGA